MSQRVVAICFVVLAAISFSGFAHRPSAATSPVTAGQATEAIRRGEVSRLNLVYRIDRQVAATDLISDESRAIRAFFAQRDFGLLAAEIEDIRRMILSQSQRSGIDPNVVLALIAVESSGNPAALSHANARGLMQLLPATAKAESDRLGLLWRGDNTLFDPVVNIQLGISYLSLLVERFGDLETALVAYNWGPTRIARCMRQGRPLPDGYRHRVMSQLASLVEAQA